MPSTPGKSFLAFVLVAAVATNALVAAESSSDAPAPAPAEPVPAIEWLTDYRAAMREAEQRRCMLLVWFQNPLHEAADTKFASLVLADPAIAGRLAKTVTVRLPLDAVVATEGDDEVRLLQHAAFAEMLGMPGLAMIDLTDAESPHYRRVVTVYPFQRQYISKHKLAVLLDLPSGTLTQRTLIYAVRSHSERPESASGPASSLLFAEAASHSQHQARINLQGHHNWDQRFHSINSRLPGHVASEVCAESWPGETLVQAAESCVDSWRQSPGHWSAVRQRHALFGYDMQRGTNGIWYATGIFARRW